MADNFVSRGGVKLQAALDQFQINVQDKVILDVGSSTGGFVDCLLQKGAKKVYALDTAYGELAWKLRNDPRVVVMERTNILHLEKLPSSVIPAKAGIHVDNYMDPDLHRDDDSKVDIVTIDAGWTKLELILPIVRNFLKQNGVIFALLKPHYEADRRDLVKGVLPVDVAEKVKDQVLEKIVHCKLYIVNYMESPILGGAGNKEYLLYLTL